MKRSDWTGEDTHGMYAEVDRELFERFKAVARQNGRALNRELEQVMRAHVEKAAAPATRRPRGKGKK